MDHFTNSYHGVQLRESILCVWHPAAGVHHKIPASSLFGLGYSIGQVKLS
jgi:hypothetical protein